jgi:hypothetical protein
MRSWLTGGLLGLALLSGEGLAAEPVAQLAQKHGWLTDYQAARAVARRDGKPLMVVFRCQP